MEQQLVTENVDCPSESEDSVCGETSAIKKHEYTRDVLLSYKLTSGNNENIASNLEEVAAKYPRIVLYELSKFTPRRSRNSQPTRNEIAPEVVGSVAENANLAGRSENYNESSMLRLKEGVLNQTRLLQMKLEQMKLKAAATANGPE